ncbi:mucin-2-like [Petaurus breviceps papuanus]|uniref:mucin-2-like n=1 Tax=Petaurus breviceps papuanus TaxID=3040969 RepID=UPI0036DDC650
MEKLEAEVGTEPSSSGLPFTAMRQPTSNKGTLGTPGTDGITSFGSPSMRQKQGYSTILLGSSASLGTMTSVTMTGLQNTDVPSPPPATKTALKAQRAAQIQKIPYILLGPQLARSPVQLEGPVLAPLWTPPHLNSSAFKAAGKTTPFVPVTSYLTQVPASSATGGPGSSSVTVTRGGTAEILGPSTHIADGTSQGGTRSPVSEPPVPTTTVSASAGSDSQLPVGSAPPFRKLLRQEAKCDYTQPIMVFVEILSPSSQLADLSSQGSTRSPTSEPLVPGTTVSVSGINQSLVPTSILTPTLLVVTPGPEISSLLSMPTISTAEAVAMETLPSTQPTNYHVSTGTNVQQIETPTESDSSPTGAAAVPKTFAGVNMGTSSLLLPLTSDETTATSDSSTPLKTSLPGTLSSPLPMTTSRAYTTTMESTSIGPIARSISPDALQKTALVSGMGASPPASLSSSPSPFSVKETGESAASTLVQAEVTAPEKPASQTPAESDSATWPIPAVTITPVPAGADTHASLAPTKGKMRLITMSASFVESTDKPQGTLKEQTRSTGPPTLPWPEALSAVVPHDVRQEANHFTTIPSPPRTGALTRQTAPPATEPTETLPSEGMTSSVGQVTADTSFPPSVSPEAIPDFITYDNRQLGNGVASPSIPVFKMSTLGRTAGSVASTTFPAEISADLQASPTGESKTGPDGYATLHHTLLTRGNRLGAGTILSPLSTMATDDIFTSSSSVTLTGEKTSSATSEATFLTMTGMDSTSTWPKILSSSPPIASSGIIHMPEDINPAAPSTKSTIPIQSSKIIDIIPPFRGATHSPDLPRTKEESSIGGLPATSSSRIPPMSSATATGGQGLLDTSGGSTPREMMTHAIAPEDLEETSALSLTTLDMVTMTSTVTVRVTEEMSTVSVRPSANAQVSSVLPPTTSSSKTFPEQSTLISHPSFTAKSMDLTTTGADISTTWLQTLPPSTSVALFGITPMPEVVSLVVPGTESLIKSNEVTDIAPLSMITDSSELPGSVAESKTGAPLTSASLLSPISSVTVTGPLSTSADSTSPGTMPHGVPRTDTEKSSGTVLAMVTTASSFTTMVMGEMSSAPPEDQTPSTLSHSAHSSMAPLGQSTVIPQPSAAAEAVTVTTTRTDATSIWSQTPSTPVTSSVVTHMTEHMSSATLATKKTNLSSSSKVTGMAPFSPVTMLSTDLPSGLGPVTHIPDHGVPGGTTTLTSGTLTPVSTVSAPGSGVGVAPATHIPDHVAPGGMAVLTSGPLTPESTVGPVEASTPPEMYSGATMGIASPTFSMPPAEYTANSVSSGPLKTSPTGVISSAFWADTPSSETSPRPSPRTTLTPSSTPVDSFHTTVSAPGMEISSILPLSSTPKAISATETRPNPDLPMRQTTLKKQGVQTVTEPDSTVLSSTAPGITPTSAGGDTTISLVSMERQTEGKTVVSIFTDTPGIIHGEHVYSSSPGGPDTTSTSSLNHLSEGPRYFRTVPLPSVGIMKSTAMNGAETSPAEPPTPEPEKPTPPEGGTPSVAPMPEFRTRDSGKLQSSLASTSTPVWETSRPGRPAASDTSTVIPGWFHAAESTVDLMSNSVEGSSPEPAVYRTPSQTPSTTETRLGGETGTSLVLTTPAPVVSITSISGAMPGIKTEVPWSLTSAEARDLTMIGTDTMSTSPPTFSPLSPVTLSEVTYKAKGMDSNVPGTESLSVILSSKVTDLVSLYLKTTPNQEHLGTVGESSTGVSLITPSAGTAMSSATIMREVPSTLGTTTGSTPKVTVAYGVPTGDSERTSGLLLATEGTVNIVTAKMTDDISMASTGNSTDVQVSSALHLTTSTSSMTLPRQSTVSPSSTTAEARGHTILETDTTPTWPRTLSSSTPVTSSGVTPFTENMSSTSPRTDATRLIFSPKITEIVSLSTVVTLSPELPSTMSEKSTNTPLTSTSTKAPLLSDTSPGGSLATSAVSTSVGTDAHSVSHADREESSELPLITLTTETTESTVTGREIAGIISAPPGFSTEAEVSSAVPPPENPTEYAKSSEAMTPRDKSPSSMWPGGIMVTPVHTGSGSSLAALSQAELSEIQSPLIITKVPQQSDTEFPLSSAATEITKTVTVTDSTLISGLEESQASKGAISGTVASRTYPTLFTPSESPMTHDTSPERGTRIDQALSTQPTEKFPETGTTSSAAFVSKMLSEVSASAPQTSTQGFESQSISTLESKTALGAGGDAGVVQVTGVPDHGAPASIAALTRGPLRAGSTVVSTGASVVTIKPNEVATSSTAALTNSSVTLSSDSSTKILHLKHSGRKGKDHFGRFNRDSHRGDNSNSRHSYNSFLTSHYDHYNSTDGS